MKAPFLTRFSSSSVAAVWLVTWLLNGTPSWAATSTNHCLWKVQGKDCSVYLLGSIHFFKKEFYPLDPPIEDAFQKSKLAVFETDLGAQRNPEVQVQVSQMGLVQPGKKLSNYVAPDVYASLTKRLKELTGKTNSFDSMRPWLAAVSLVSLELQQLGFNPENGVDQYFFRRAGQKGKPIASLETAEFQLGLFRDLSPAEEQAFLQQTVKEANRFPTIFGGIIESWRKGDGDSLTKLLLESMKEHPRLYQRFLVERNARWTEKIESYLKGKEDVFIVVGAGHLVGPDSVISLLRQKKFPITQL